MGGLNASPVRGRVKSPGAARAVPANYKVENPTKSAVRAGPLPFISHSVLEEGLLPSTCCAHPEETPAIAIATSR